MVLAGINVVGAVGRLAGGRLSDRLAVRVGLIRLIALASAVVLAAATALLGTTGWLLVPALVLGGGLSMSWNGLSVAAVVETAGSRRSGAALGLQQTMLGVGRHRHSARLRAVRGRDLVARGIRRRGRVPAARRRGAAPAEAVVSARSSARALAGAQRGRPRAPGSRCS